MTRAPSGRLVVVVGGCFKKGRRRVARGRAFERGGKSKKARAWGGGAKAHYMEAP